MGSILDFLLSGFTGSQGGGLSSGGLGGLLSGLTGSTNPLTDILGILSFIQQGQFGQESSGFNKALFNALSSSLGTAGSPGAQAAWAKALAPQGMSVGQFGQDVSQLTPSPVMTPGQYASTMNQMTQKLSPTLTYNTLQPVRAALSAQGQNQSPATQQYVSQQALAPDVLQEQQMGQAGTNSILQELLAQQAQGFSGAQDILNQYLTEQQSGVQQSQFGLGLPFSAAPISPQFGFANSNSGGDLQSILNMLGGSSFGTGGTFGSGTGIPGLQQLLQGNTP